MQLLSKKILSVVANPFAAPLSPDGRPIAAFQFDPVHSPGVVQFIGAALERVLVDRRPAFGAQQSRFAKTVRFDLSPQPIVDSHYHREAIRRGELFAADAATAKIVGIDPVKGVEELLAADGEAALKAWATRHPDEEALDVAPWFEGDRPLLANWPIQVAAEGKPAPEAPAGVLPKAARVDVAKRAKAKADADAKAKAEAKVKADAAKKGGDA